MARYSKIPKTNSPTGKKMYQTVKYPEIPKSFEDVYVYTTAGDRFDTLAQQYYGDSSLWWVIANANSTLTQNSLTPPLGFQIRIPSNPTPTLSEFNKINKPSTTSTPQPNSGGGY